MSALRKLWRESASLIICGRNANNIVHNGANFRVSSEPHNITGAVNLSNVVI